MIARILLPLFEVRDGFVFSFRALEGLMVKGRMLDVVLLMLGLMVAWFIYTPIHELLHVAGCEWSGGHVSELALAPEYGAHLLREIFPFVVPESDYAGQLTGFTVPSRMSYVVTIMLPYVLSLAGLPLLEWCRRKTNVGLAGLAYILAFVPFMSIPGDMFEVVSLFVSPIGEVFTYPGLDGYLVSDDVFKLIGILRDTGQWSGTNQVLVGVTFIGSIYVAMQLFALQVYLLRRIEK